MALNLVVAAIILWNTAYLDRAIQVLNEEGISVPEEYLAHISPLGWEHITITGTYHWRCGSALGTFPIPPPRRRRVSKGRDRLAFNQFGSLASQGSFDSFDISRV